MYRIRGFGDAIMGPTGSCDPLSNTCIPTSNELAVAAQTGQVTADASAALTLTDAQNAAGLVYPSVTNTEGSPSAQSSQNWLYAGLAAGAALLLFLMGGRR